MERIAQSVPAGGLVGIDTSAFIYHLEADATRGPAVGQFFEDLAAGTVLGVTSVLTLLELLVQPFRMGRRDAAADFEAFLYEYPHLRVVDVDREITRTAAELRATYRLRPMDSPANSHVDA